GKILAIRELGGVKNGVGLHVAGAAEFQPGEDVVVFLNDRNKDGTYDIRGMMMGKYNVKRMDDGSEALIGPGLALGRDHKIVEDDARDQEQADPGITSGWTLDRLRRLIEEQKDHPPKAETQEDPDPSDDDNTLAAEPEEMPSGTPSTAPRLQSSDGQAEP